MADTTDPPAAPGRRSLILDAIIRLSQHTGRGASKISFNVLKETFVAAGPAKRTESDHEAAGLDEFLVRFHDGILDDLRGRRILDLGCGYGGKAVELARRLPTSTVIGVETHAKKTVKAVDFAERQGVTNCTFALCTQETIPLGDESVDAIVNHDVLEHVHDPAATIREMHRVLTKGGKAYVIFPPYDGPASHHLDYITQMPFLHWFFAPDTIMATVNGLLASEYGRRFKTPPQPPAQFSPSAGKRVLPSLNGLGTTLLMKFTGPLFHIRHIERLTVIDRLVKFRVPKRAAAAAKRATLAWFPAAADHLTITMAMVMEKK